MFFAFLGTEGTPDSVNPSVIDDEEEGLPSPPLDEGAFFAAQTTSMELTGVLALYFPFSTFEDDFLECLLYIDLNFLSWVC